MIIVLATNILPHGIIKYLKILNKCLMPSTCNYMGMCDYGNCIIWQQCNYICEDGLCIEFWTGSLKLIAILIHPHGWMCP